MDSLDQARDTRAKRLRDARYSVKLLIRYVKKHAAAVDGEDRAHLLDIVGALRPWSVWLESVGVDGATATSVPASRLLDALEAVADAGSQALQMLGARLARPEGWGGPFEEDEGRHELDDDPDDD